MARVTTTARVGRRSGGRRRRRRRGVDFPQLLADHGPRQTNLQMSDATIFHFDGTLGPGEEAIEHIGS